MGDGRPNATAQTYYRQRASAGLIISEAAQISPVAKGYLDTPGIYNDAQVGAWKNITAAVHAAGGRIFCQLWHVGRISHLSLLPDGASPVSSTSRGAKAKTFTKKGFEPASTPVALDANGIAQTAADYAHAAQCAKDAGFDGIEIHAANGYLIDQFLQDSVNDRDDEYGGSIANRMRFLQQVLDAVSGVWPTGRVGVRLAPLGHFNDVGDSDREALFGAVYEMLGARHLAYLHVVERFPGATPDNREEALIKRLRKRYAGIYIANGDYDKQAGENALATGHADAIAYGRPFIANPDLPERFRRDAALNTPDQATFYGGNETGYTDYPSLDSANA